MSKVSKAAVFKLIALCLLVVGVLFFTTMLTKAGGGIQGLEAQKVSEQLALAVKYLAVDDFEQAILAFDAAIEIDPKAEPAYKGLAAIYRLQGDLEKSRAVLQQGLQEIPASVALKIDLARLYLIENDYNHSYKLLDELKDTAPARDNPKLWGLLAELYINQGKLPAAIAVLEEGLQKLPENTYLQVALASMYHRVGEQDRAKDILAGLDLSNLVDQKFLIDLALHYWEQDEIWRAAGVASYLFHQDEYLQELLAKYTANLNQEQDHSLRWLERDLRRHFERQIEPLLLEKSDNLIIIETINFIKQSLIVAEKINISQVDAGKWPVVTARQR